MNICQQCGACCAFFRVSFYWAEALPPELPDSCTEQVMTELRRTRINDLFTKGGYIRADGVMIHDMYVMQVKSPQESKYPWDYYKVVTVMPGTEAFGPITGRCPLAPK